MKIAATLSYAANTKSLRFETRQRRVDELKAAGSLASQKAWPLWHMTNCGQNSVRNQTDTEKNGIILPMKSIKDILDYRRLPFARLP